MIPALWISKTGLDSQQTNISVTSNNLANASTVGFKRSRAIFEDLLYQKVNQPGGRSSANSYLPEGLMVGCGSKVVATQRQFGQGDVESTDNSFDLMIDGRGFFEIELPDGTCLGFNSSTNISWANVQVFIDVNGSNKKPNILGKDLFYFSYDPNTNSIKPYGYQYEETYCGRAVPNGVMHRGAGCAMKIMRDNWEIKKDYPWK